MCSETGVWWDNFLYSTESHEKKVKKEENNRNEIQIENISLYTNIQLMKILRIID